MQKIKGPKSHHYVPRMLLKRFSNSSGNLFYFNRSEPEKGIRERAPKNLFEETHLYSLTSDDGTKDPKVEMDFAKEIEDPANHVLERMLLSVGTGTFPNLTAQEKVVWNRFFYLQWKRTPEHLDKTLSSEQSEAMLDGFLKEYETLGRPLTSEETIKFQDPNHRRRIINNAKIEAVASKSEEVLDILNGKQLLFLRSTKPNRGFIIGSNPVVKICHPDRADLNDPTVEVWLPISPKIAISPFSLNAPEHIVTDPDHKHFRAINETIYGNSNIVAAESEALLASLVRKEYPDVEIRRNRKL